jgi:hypothetical protein
MGFHDLRSLVLEHPLMLAVPLCAGLTWVLLSLR